MPHLPTLALVQSIELRPEDDFPIIISMVHTDVFLFEKVSSIINEQKQHKDHGGLHPSKKDNEESKPILSMHWI